MYKDVHENDSQHFKRGFLGGDKGKNTLSNL